MGTSRTTTYSGQTIVVSKPSATNTIVMVSDRSEMPGVYVYDAQFLQSSLGSKYGVTPTSGSNGGGKLTADQRMTACNQEAGSMKGDVRKQFMTTCLAAKR